MFPDKGKEPYNAYKYKIVICLLFKFFFINNLMLQISTVFHLEKGSVEPILNKMLRSILIVHDNNSNFLATMANRKINCIFFSSVKNSIFYLQCLYSLTYAI
ncbi:hypothetical protein KUTeg_002521 [Tegillarca granosa]|uniref:Uncharacterized protein n=1 Tax=Tegillarca granosa TaxID=220873 RepID=A0ABQ9FUJ8_TEGGR|nr:hypothetical protein KUTeg_002521 [Tegillarca granosa]